MMQCVLQPCRSDNKAELWGKTIPAQSHGSRPSSAPEETTRCSTIQAGDLEVHRESGMESRQRTGTEDRLLPDQGRVREAPAGHVVLVASNV